MTLRTALHAWTWRWPAEQPADAVIPHRADGRRDLRFRGDALRQFVQTGEMILRTPRHIPAIVGWTEYSIREEPVRGGPQPAVARIEFSEYDPGSVTWLRCQWTRRATVNLPCGSVRVPLPLDAPRPMDMPSWRRTAFLKAVIQSAVAVCKAALDPAVCELGDRMADADRDMARRAAVLANLAKPFDLVQRPVVCNLPDPSLARPGIMATDAPMTDPSLSEIPVDAWASRPRIATWRSLIIPDSAENHILISTPPRLDFAMSEIDDPIAAMKALRKAA